MKIKKIFIENYFYSRIIFLFSNKGFYAAKIAKILGKTEGLVLIQIKYLREEGYLKHSSSFKKKKSYSICYDKIIEEFLDFLLKKNNALATNYKEISPIGESNLEVLKFNEKILTNETFKKKIKLNKILIKIFELTFRELASFYEKNPNLKITIKDVFEFLLSNYDDLTPISNVLYPDFSTIKEEEIPLKFRDISKKIKEKKEEFLLKNPHLKEDYDNINILSSVIISLSNSISEPIIFKAFVNALIALEKSDFN